MIRYYVNFYVLGVIHGKINEYTYPIFIFYGNISFVLNQVLYCVLKTSSSCPVQGSVLMERVEKNSRCKSTIIMTQKLSSFRINEYSFVFDGILSLLV